MTLFFKTLSALAAAALGAAVVLALPGFSPDAEAITQPPVVKSSRLDVHPTGADCTQQAWPYYAAQCVWDQNQVAGQSRSVRLITTDRIAAR